MVDELMSSSGTDKRGANYESARELSFNCEVIRLDVSAVEHSWEGTAADDRTDRHGSHAGRKIRNSDRRNPRRKRSERREAIGTGEILWNGKRVRIAEYARHGKRIVADSITEPDHGGVIQPVGEAEARRKHFVADGD